MTENVKTRFAPAELRIEPCEEKDSERIAEGLYEAFGEDAWGTWEPASLRPPLYSTRVTRQAGRLAASFSNPNMHWLKAVHVPTNQIIGVAGWMGPGNPVHSIFRRSSVEFYNWRAERGWSDEDVEEMWTGCDLSVYETEFANNDEIRKEVLGEEPHWFLAPLLVFPGFQGRGVGSALLKWAIEQADRTDPPVPMYLEASPMGRPVYVHYGFKEVGKKNMLRRGPKAVDDNTSGKATTVETGGADKATA